MNNFEQRTMANKHKYIKSGKTARLKMRFKAWRNDRLVIDTTRSSKGRLRGIMQAQKADKYYIKITYGKGWTTEGFKEIYNDGVYTNKKDLLRAFSIFTSKDEIIDYLENFSTEKEDGKR